MYDQAEDIQKLIKNSKSVVIVQADNPDGDSLGSALALEQIFADLDLTTYLYCAVDMPGYLHYMKGWDRVVKDLPRQFDCSVIVDASTMTLLEKLANSGQQGWLASKPCLILDHHEIVENQIPFASIKINDFKKSSTGELIYEITKQLDWPLNLRAQEFIMTSILGDTQGLTNQLASARTYEVMAEMITAGVDRPALEELRREAGKMPELIYRYKAKLIQRTEIINDGTIAMVVIPQEEINGYSPLYNPAALIQGDMLQTAGIKITVVLKRYDDGKVTGAIRANAGSPIAANLADRFGGGGHKFASGFKIDKVADFSKLKTEFIQAASEMVNNLESPS
jgi:phosphoesterase RecJ-like protein